MTYRYAIHRHCLAALLAAGLSLQTASSMPVNDPQLANLRDNIERSYNANNAKAIESIRQAIAEGRFQVDEEAVAEGLVRETISNLGRRASQQDN